MKRIIGIDIARALAVIGMILVNFKIVFGDQGDSFLKAFVQLFDGKAAATFVVLAGVGLALMTRSAMEDQSLEKLKIARKKVMKRAVFLFVTGLSYLWIWPADILHFYGVYMLVALLFIHQRPGRILVSCQASNNVQSGVSFAGSPRCKKTYVAMAMRVFCALTSHKIYDRLTRHLRLDTTLAAAVVIIFLFPVALLLWDYETGWNFDTLEYEGFWTWGGFWMNLFYNGFHPVVPWTAFMLYGLWYGRQDLHNTAFVKRSCWVSLLVFIFVQLISFASLQWLSGGDKEAVDTLKSLVGTGPMPPMPLYMASGISVATAVISSCILLGKRYENSRILGALEKTGQLTLTFYVAHVVIGMGIMEEIGPLKLGAYPIEFSVAYAFIFSLCCIFFARFWLKHRKMGPVEWIMRKAAG